MAFVVDHPTLGRWSPEAGGYVKGGQVTSRTPVYSDDGGTSTTTTTSTNKKKKTGTTTTTSGGGGGASSQTTLRQWAAQQGYGVDYDPATETVYIGGAAYRAGQVPGTRYDPAAGIHYVTDPAALGGALQSSAVSPAIPAARTTAQQPAIAQPVVQPPEQLRPPERPRVRPYDYEAAFERYMAALPSELTRVRTLEEVMPEAERYAQLMVAPQLDAISKRLAALGAQRESALQHVQSAYAGYPERLQRAYEEARQKALESAIARGLGRSGVVDWQAQKLGERLSELIAENEAKKAAALAEVERNYQTELANLEAQRQTLAARQGEYARQFAEDLRRGYLDRVMDAIKQARELATEESRALREYLPYLVPTVGQEYEHQRDLVEQFGSAPGAATSVSPEAAFRAIGHISYFGSPETYLEAIRRRVYGEEPGGLSDREAAIAFLNQLLWMRPDIEAQVRALLSRIAS